MSAILRQRSFVCLWTGQLISLIGDWMLLVALPFYMYTVTGSTLATGLLFIVQTIPRLCLGSVAGVFVDRWNRKYTMIATNLVQAAVLIPLFLLRSSEWIQVIYIFAFLDSIVAQFFIPAQSAIIPQLVAEADVLAANSLNSTSSELTRLIGPFLGGLLLGVSGLNSVIIVDICSFLFSALMISLVVLAPRPGGEQNAGLRAGSGKIWQEWSAGLHLVRHEGLVLAFFIVMGVAMVGEGLVEVLFPGYVKQVLDGNAVVLGWLMSAQAVGGIAGSLLIVRLSAWISPRLLISLCGLIFGGLLAVIALIHTLVIVLPLVTLIGACVIGFFVSQLTLIQSTVANEYQGRVFGAFSTLQAVSMVLGMGLASSLGDRLGIVSLLLLDAACNLLAAGLAFTLIHPPLSAGLSVPGKQADHNETASAEMLIQDSSGAGVR
jgi:MFS family permease